MWQIPFAAGALAAFLLTAPAAYLIGDWWGSHETEARAELRSQLAAAQAARDTAQRDLVIAVQSETQAKVHAEINRQAAQEAEERADEYEQVLKARGDDVRCRLSPDDLGWLRSRSEPRSAPAPPTRQ